LQPPRDMSGARGAERELASIARDDMKWALRLNTEDRKGNVSSAAEVLSRGDVVYVEKKEEGGGYRLRQPPKVQGALVAMEPKTGRVVAMVGGFSFAQSEFNRASQAYRQPGSSFKPFVYAAALDNGYTPSSVIMDAPISLPDGNGGVWEPSNYGGGSADAAALLRMIGDAVPAVRDALLARATTLGADVPMCIAGRAARVSGIGEKIKPLANLPALHMLLVNPGVPVSTPAVFAALEQRDNAPLPPVPAQGFRTAAELVAWLDGTRNDLAAPAERLAPQIVAVRDALAGDGALIARMSGSGATVYGLFEDDARLARARSRIAASHPEWWLSGARHPATPADLTLEAP
ncbi:4-(cytidine 5'-diphospho)-2-C-methyl-D-erythritol kinase, partial [Aurantimonas manganoxydans]|uniref:4-(cytidine 5'-diphospho)-2-C-methyl-D-erythritol kinase n=1 Tax=Aurantimonas manganoxydans TaxID=651183 RepID=UPI0011D2437B